MTCCLGNGAGSAQAGRLPPPQPEILYFPQPPVRRRFFAVRTAPPPPDSAAGSGSLDQFPVLPSLSSSMSSTSVSSNSTSGSLSPMASTSPLHPVSMFAGSFVPTPPELQGLTPIRVKGRPQTDNVPVPPGVKEKRRRASLGIRKSSDESDCSATHGKTFFFQHTWVLTEH